VKKLQQLHDKHLTRPDFDENSSEEKEIESITKDITAVTTSTLSKHFFQFPLDVKWVSYICSTTFRTSS
jgi:hypothetical protein